MSAHLQLEGGWADCPAPESCALLFHFDMTADEAAAIPIETLYPLFEAIQPPTRIIDGWLKIWEVDGEPHRDYDLPAEVYANDEGHYSWYRHGDLHREGDKPAMVDRRAHIWCKDGNFHRDDDKPARILFGRVQQWYRHGKLHRANDLPAMVYDDGGLEWYQLGKLHRRGERPAFMWVNGRREWAIRGKRSRTGWAAPGIPDPYEETQLLVVTD